MSWIELPVRQRGDLMQSRARRVRCEAGQAEPVVSADWRSLERAEGEGFQAAFLRGAKETECPYWEDTPWGKRWREGWRRGMWRAEGRDESPPPSWWPGGRDE